MINGLRKELEKLYINQWENERQNILRKQQKSRLELYSDIKSSYRREAYIDDVRDIQTRKCITQIRLSAHKFPIEQGRYKNIPREQRICNLCCNDLVGDEFHYLFICNEFSLTQRRQTFVNDAVPSGGNVTCLEAARQRDSREANFNELSKTIAT